MRRIKAGQLSRNRQTAFPAAEALETCIALLSPTEIRVSLVCGGVRAALVEQIEELNGVETDHVARAGHDGERILDAQPVQFLAGLAGTARPLGVVAAYEGSNRDALEAFECGKGAGVGRDTGQHGQREKAVRKLGNNAIGGEAAVGDAGEMNLAALEQDRVSHFVRRGRSSWSRPV